MEKRKKSGRKAKLSRSALKKIIIGFVLFGAAGFVSEKIEEDTGTEATEDATEGKKDSESNKTNEDEKDCDVRS